MISYWFRGSRFPVALDRTYQKHGPEVLVIVIVWMLGPGDSGGVSSAGILHACRWLGANLPVDDDGPECSGRILGADMRVPKA